MENAAPFSSSNLKSEIAKYHPFLLEARKRLLFTLFVFFTTSIAGFFLYDNIIKFLIDILSLKGVNIVFTSPFQFINLAISCGFAVGIVITLPLLVFQILSFLKPALREKEYKTIIKLLPFSAVLFLSGFVFGTLIMKWQIKLFLEKSIELGIGNILDISRLLQTVIITSVLIGVAFEFPLMLLLLLKIGLIEQQQLRKIRKWIYIGSFLFAILLPLDSILVDILLALPVIILFELVMVIHKLTNRKHIH